MNFIVLLCMIASTLLQAPDCDQTKLRQLAQRADVILIAQVVEVKPSPGYWSGVAPSVQQVRYEVKSVLKGDVINNEIVVGHYIVRNSLTSDDDYPQLSQRLFAPGNELVIFLKANVEAEENSISEEIKYISLSENCGAIPASNETIKRVLDIISSNKSRKQRGQYQTLKTSKMNTPITKRTSITKRRQ